jgi:hypothetical protein
MEHELLNGEFSQGYTLASLDGEMAVQQWIGDRLSLKKNRSYTVVREAHVFEEKEPDIRFLKDPLDVPMEIKVAESWSVGKLESALVDQLCGRYLRDSSARHGILLLVHQKVHRWRNPRTRKGMSFPEVVAYLRKRADALCAKAGDRPRPVLSVFDVSTLPKNRRVKRK